MAAEPFVAVDRCFYERQFDNECAALTECRLDIDGAAHCFGEPTRKGEPDTGTFDIGAVGSESFKRHKQKLEMLGADAGTGVGNLEANPCRLALFTGNRNRAADAVVLDRVGDQIQQNLLEPLAVGEYILRAARSTVSAASTTFRWIGSASRPSVPL